MMILNRRELMKASTGTIAGSAIAITASSPVNAAGPSVRAQPGFYRLKVGAIEVTVISDGFLKFPATTLFDEHATSAQELLTSTFRPANPVGLQLNTTLIRTSQKLVLIDAGGGAAGKFQPTAGKLLNNFAAAGYSPRDVDMVVLTHGHSDHLWGISDRRNQSLLFPSAEFVASEPEVKFCSSPELTANLNPALRPEVTRANLRLAGPRLKLIKAGAQVAPGITTLDTPGHTPGHMSVLVHSGDAQLLLTSDVVVNYPVDFYHPEWPFGFDQDKPLAALSRMRFLDRASSDKTLVSGYHLPFPGIGHVVREGSIYRWVPADWQWNI